MWTFPRNPRGSKTQVTADEQYHRGEHHDQEDCVHLTNLKARPVLDSFTFSVQYLNGHQICTIEGCVFSICTMTSTILV